jgi:hypothetical protein
VSEPVPAIVDPSLAEFLRMAGRAAMELRSRPKFTALEGGRRKLGPRSPGRADLKIIRKENAECRR